MGKVVIYIRTSTNKQNPENQLSDCRSICRKEWGAPVILEDEESAFKEDSKRPGFGELLAMVKRGEVSHVVVWDFDRIYRRKDKFKEVLALFKAFKVQLHSYRQNWMEMVNNIPPPFDEIIYDMLISLFGWLAEEESRRKGDRIRAAIRVRRGVKMSYKGNVWGRKPLSTYKKNRIRKMAGKYSIRAIARKLNISIGAVHKYLAEIQGKKMEK